MQFLFVVYLRLTNVQTFFYGSNMKISNADVNRLADKFGTPLYVYDENKLADNMAAYINNFQSQNFKTEVLYASKAFSCVEMVKLVKNCGLSLDVVSGGELYVAQKAGFDMSKVYFHGNNKSAQEIDYALSVGVGTIIIDNFQELQLIDKLAKEKNAVVKVLFRLNIGVDAHTHKYISTTLFESKFGMMPNGREFKDCLVFITNTKNIVFDGLHCHIGSQVFETNAYKLAIDKMVAVLKQFDKPLTLNIGGGFGVRYTSEDKPVPIAEMCKTLTDYTEQALANNRLKINKLLIEPGRSIVGEAGSTVYTIGFTKKIPTKTFYFVDGGMTDNIRPALYQAKYDCDVVDKGEEKTQKVTVAGKCCESGDLLVEDILLQEAQSGDRLIVYTTGAYGYSMSSNYNKATTPAVVFVKDGKAREVVRRQSYADLVSNDVDGDYYEFL